MRRAYLIITIDTEEDQWGITNDKLSLTNVKSLVKLQNFLDEENILPTYLVDYPVVGDDSAVEILSKIISKGRCEIGAHLHPWNSPPICEEINNRNTMMANLPFELQLAKIEKLTQYITSRLGRRPTSFRAGRWGLGKETIRALIECGYRIDTSVTPFFSWECYEGPSFAQAPFKPYFLDGTEDVRCPWRNKIMGGQKILEVPVSIGYNRWPFEKWQSVYLTFSKLPAYLHAGGILYRSNLLKKIWLSPEIDSANNMLTLSKIILDHGISILNMNFHSNSLIPGLGPFVRNENDLSRFYDNLRKYIRRMREIAEITPAFLSDARVLLLQGGDSGF